MVYKNLCTKKVYTDKEGNEKAKWLPFGTLKILDSGKMFIEANHMPNETVYVFDQDKKENKTEAGY